VSEDARGDFAVEEPAGAGEADAGRGFEQPKRGALFEHGADGCSERDPPAVFELCRGEAFQEPKAQHEPVGDLPGG
jgi:hypothetical protein